MTKILFRKRRSVWRSWLHRRIAWLSGAAAWTLHVASPAALGQTRARLPGEGGGALPWVLAAGILVVVMAAAFINPKRTHQS